MRALPGCRCFSSNRYERCLPPLTGTGELVSPPNSAESYTSGSLATLQNVNLDNRTVLTAKSTFDTHKNKSPSQLVRQGGVRQGEGRRGGVRAGGGEGGGGGREGEEGGER